MVDIHTHIICDIDDGARGIDESKRMINEAYNHGIKYLVLTPHYVNNSLYKADNATKQKKSGELLSYLKETNKNMQIFLGNEIYVEDNVIDLINDGKVMSINNSRYLLIEFPIFQSVNNVRDLIFNIRLKGYIPVIAHPERYEMFHKNLSLAEELFSQGALYQADLGSLLGNYGTSAKKTLKEMLKKNLIFCVASDVHHANEIYANYDKALKKLGLIVGKRNVEILTTSNPLRIIKNEEVY